MDDLPRQLANRLPLKCGKCKHTDRVEIKDEEIHCHYCGNFAIVGMKTRWPFVAVEKDVQNYSENYSKSNYAETGTSPLQTGENVSKKEENVGTHGKKCTASGCEKGAWLKGLCHKHYIEKYGEYIPENPFKNRVKKDKPETKGAITEMKEAKPERKEPGENEKDPGPLPGIRVIIPDKLLEKLAVVAEREYRTINQQAAYFITKGLERE